MKEKWVYTKTNAFKYFKRMHAKKKEYFILSMNKINKWTEVLQINLHKSTQKQIKVMTLVLIIF
jgi:hypothetical protein